MKLITMVTVLLLSSCANESERYKDRLPAFQFDHFFEGELCAKGLVRARDGTVNRKFVASIVATSSADRVELDEVFAFDDQEMQTRLWIFDKTDYGWSGTAGDVVGIASGKTVGDSFNLTYQLKIQVDGEEYHVSMNDWLHQIDKRTLMGSTDMSKWGINLGRIDIVIQKISTINKQLLIQNNLEHVSNCIAFNDLTNRRKI